MEKITINVSGFRSEILVGENWESVRKLLPDNGVVIITDDNVNSLYGDRFPEVPVFKVLPGEGSKKLAVVEILAEKLLESGIDRSGFVLAVGGGVVSDLAGFLASVYMRGIRCGYVSTTLLSQVDASTGGKNGVNLGINKNMLGIIRQPEFVICDPAMLITLPEQEYLSGLAELIKTAIIGDSGLFDQIEKNYSKIIERDYTLLTELVAKSVNFKARVVNEDERESGLRRILNFGHTFGHAVEMQKLIKHGFAVASGMELATYFSLENGLISQSETERIVEVLKKFALLDDYDIPADRIEKIIFHDKKKSGSDINFVFTEGIGKSVVRRVPVDEIMNFYRRFKRKK